MSYMSKSWSIILVLGALIIALALVLFYNERGVFHLWQLRLEMEELKKANQRLEAENQDLLKKIDRIKNDPKFIEDEARKKLGLVKPDEQIYRVKEE